MKYVEPEMEILRFKKGDVFTVDRSSEITEETGGETIIDGWN